MSTARIEAETLAESRGLEIDALSATLELVEQQQREILSLSAPILDVGEQTLAIPIIGRLRETLSAQITARLLDAIASRRARYVILDLTGVVAIPADVEFDPAVGGEGDDYGDPARTRAGDGRVGVRRSADAAFAGGGIAGDSEDSGLGHDLVRVSTLADHRGLVPRWSA